MRCPDCGAGSGVMDSRPCLDGFVWRRRRRCDKGHRFTSYEVNATYGAFIVSGAGTNVAFKRLDLGDLRTRMLAEVNRSLDRLEGTVAETEALADA